MLALIHGISLLRLFGELAACTPLRLAAPNRAGAWGARAWCYSGRPTRDPIHVSQGPVIGWKFLAS